MLTFDQVDIENLTPMMQQYLTEKEKRPDCLIFFRLGDFYELFFDDAIVASRELELTLTGKDCGLSERAPMCGVPHHAADNYILRLVKKGFKVAIVEQVEDPAQAKGLVKREVIKIVTPGTLTDQGYLDEKKYSFIASIFMKDQYYGLAVCDISTGFFETCEINHGVTNNKLIDEIARYKPSEILCNNDFASTETCKHILEDVELTLTVQPDSTFQISAIERYSEFMELTGEYSLWAAASACLLAYIENTQFRLPKEIKNIKPYKLDEFMLLDQNARRNLELTETIRERKRKGSLLWAIDKTATGMGSRLLRYWIEQPLLDLDLIQKRQNAIAYFLDHFIERQEIIALLKNLYDLERLSGRIALGQVNARDLYALIDILERIKPLKDILGGVGDPYLTELEQNLSVLPDLISLLKASLRENPPLSLKDGGIIKEGYHELVDKYRDAAINGKNWILELEKKEREKTGIKSLKVGYNRIFGYYIDVRKTNLDLVPDSYIRRQTLTNSERYITEELKQMENEILGSEQKLIALEYKLFLEIRDEVTSQVLSLKNNASVIAQLDVLCSLAALAEKENYCKPIVNYDDQLIIQGGRHPVVEKSLPGGSFVPNNTELNGTDKKIMILTGPNMSGKSTYMRQVALIVLLAQIGSFIPAESARIGIVDRIFTRVGASDDLASGQSTFMVEMNEVAQIMRNATRKSLLILDEIGRGTSTYDGLSIAWSVVEHIVDPNYISARTLFATHYHELTDLADSTQGIFNCHISATNKEEGIVFLHQIKEGSAGESYGIEVAELAGVPDTVVNRAREILHQLEKDNHGKRLTIKKTARPLDGQVDLFSAAQNFNQSVKVVEHLKNIDMDYVSPVDARKILEELIAEAKGKI